MKKIKWLILIAGVLFAFKSEGYSSSGSLPDYPVKLWRSSETTAGMTPTLFSSSGPIVIHNIIQVSTRTTGGCGEMSVLSTQVGQFDTTAATIAHRSFVNPDTVESPFNVISTSGTYVQSTPIGCQNRIIILWEWLTHLSMSHIPF